MVFERGNGNRSIYVCHNQYVGGCKKGHLLQMCLVQGERMTKWFKKLFRRLLIATVPISMIVYVKNIRQKVDHLKFRTDFIKGLLIKYSMHCKMPGYRGGNNPICRLPGWASTEKKSEQTRQCMWSAAIVI